MQKIAFVHDVAPQRVVFAAGAVGRVAEETARLKISRALVLATPGSGERLGKRVLDLVGPRGVGLYAEAILHVPKAVAEQAVAAARTTNADGLIAAGGGAAIGVAKIVARDLGLPVLAVPTTYSGSEATAIWGLSEGERKFTGKDPRVLPRGIIYDPELTQTLPAPVSAASAMNAMAHCVEALWVADRTAFTEALATEGARRLRLFLPRIITDGTDTEARAHCLIAAWLAGTVLSAGTALQHKLAHVLGGLGLPHAETHAVILPYVTRFNLVAAPDARTRLGAALGEPADEALFAMLRALPLPQRLSELGFSRKKIDFVAAEVAALSLTVPRAVSAAQVRELLEAAY